MPNGCATSDDRSSAREFGLSDLLDILSTYMGLPRCRWPEREDLYLSDLGLDSFDFAHLQVQLVERRGVDLPDERDREFTLGEIVGMVRHQLV